jgi:hypothetical protein
MTAPACGRPGCGKPPRTDGFCDKDYKYRLYLGLCGMRDAGPAFEHVRALYDTYHWTWRQIAAAAGTGHAVPRDIYGGVSKRIYARTERAILAIPLGRFRESERVIPAIGTRRRVQALAWMGWPNWAVAERIGYPPGTLTAVIYRDVVSVRMATRVRAVYGELSGQPGPSKHAAVKARRNGNAPPAAWDDGEIDDPKARPRGVRREVAA